jgi:pimeloyl-ACP methyl ester carboxylesterase
MTLSGIGSPLEFRVFHINGVALHVVLAGPVGGKPLVFLHGFPEFWFGWRHQIDHFVSSGYHVIIMAKESLQYCDDGHLEMLETAAHWVQHEEPARVNSLLSQFFTG